MVPQLMVTKGARARRLAVWMYLASMVFPVPDSPVMSTVESKVEIRRMVSRVLRIPRSERIISSGGGGASSRRRAMGWGEAGERTSRISGSAAWSSRT